MKLVKIGGRASRLGSILGAALFAAAGISSAAAAATLTTLGKFTIDNGANPVSNLIADADGDLFGTTYNGGDLNCGGGGGCGTVFEIACTSFSTPCASYGPLAVLANFNGAEGENPPAGLIADADGNLFGTTQYGGMSANCNGGCGTVFEIKKDTSTTSGYATKPTVLVSFDHADGAHPHAGLIADADGNLFGTTRRGGNAPNNLTCVDRGCGTVFEIKKDSSTTTGYAAAPTVLYKFCATIDSTSGLCTFGAIPDAGLIADAQGNLFGTTAAGGPSGSCGFSGCGTVFELKRDSGTTTGYADAATVLVSFDGTHGEDPEAGLIADAQGNLFGTTVIGGQSTNCFGGPCGTVFEIKKDTSTTTGYATIPTILASFNLGDGDQPVAGLIADADGNLFGTTQYGGHNGFYPLYLGTVFEIKKDTSTTTGYADTATVLFSFNGYDGAYPRAGLIADADGNLFGTTETAGGTSYDNTGTVFELSGSGFVAPQVFTGIPETPGTVNCVGVNEFTLAHTYGGLAHAAASLGYASEADLETAVAAYCGG